MVSRIEMKEKTLEELAKLIEEEAKSPPVVLPFHYEYPDSKVVELVPVAINAIKKHHQGYDVTIGAYDDVILVSLAKPVQAKKPPLTLQRNIHSVSFYVKDEKAELWVNARSHPWTLKLLKKAGIITTMARFEAEMKDSWGGYGHECGGAYYVYRILKNGEVIAEGQASYNACIPGHEGANYAYTEVKLVKPEQLLVDEFLFQP